MLVVLMSLHWHWHNLHFLVVQKFGPINLFVVHPFFGKMCSTNLINYTYYHTPLYFWHNCSLCVSREKLMRPKKTLCERIG